MNLTDVNFGNKMIAENHPKSVDIRRMNKSEFDVSIAASDIRLYRVVHSLYRYMYM